jgi:ABC-type uncharacterized transport system substrate-binding protein
MENKRYRRSKIINANLIESGYFELIRKEEKPVTVKHTVTGMAAVSRSRSNQIIFC